MKRNPRYRVVFIRPFYLFNLLTFFFLFSFLYNLFFFILLHMSIKFVAVDIAVYFQRFIIHIKKLMIKVKLIRDFVIFLIQTKSTHSA